MAVSQNRQTPDTSSMIPPSVRSPSSQQEYNFFPSATSQQVSNYSPSAMGKVAPPPVSTTPSQVFKYTPTTMAGCKVRQTSRAAPSTVSNPSPVTTPPPVSRQEFAMRYHPASDGRIKSTKHVTFSDKVSYSQETEISNRSVEPNSYRASSGQCKNQSIQQFQPSSYSQPPQQGYNNNSSQVVEQENMIEAGSIEELIKNQVRKAIREELMGNFTKN